MDQFRAYKVLIDNKEVGKINENQEKQFPVTPGNHTIQLKIDWCTSKPISFTQGDSTSIFRCKSKSNFLGGFFSKGDYMELSQLASQPAANVIVQPDNGVSTVEMAEHYKRINEDKEEDLDHEEEGDISDDFDF